MQTQIERKEANQRTTVPISTRVTKPMYEAILRFLKCSAHINTSDYLRDLIREDLERKGVFKEGADP
jgi:Arc/MetJ-type ribon-helix-helix transcriptional regulator